MRDGRTGAAPKGYGARGVRVKNDLEKLHRRYAARRPGRLAEANALRSSVPTSPRASRNSPARAIMAALSVASRGVGAYTVAPVVCRGGTHGLGDERPDDGVLKSARDIRPHHGGIAPR